MIINCDRLSSNENHTKWFLLKEKKIAFPYMKSRWRFDRKRLLIRERPDKDVDCRLGYVNVEDISIIKGKLPNNAFSVIVPQAVTNNENASAYLLVNNYKEVWTRPVGYLYVSENEYVELRRSTAISCTILCIAILLLGIIMLLPAKNAVCMPNTTQNNQLTIADGDVWDGNMPVNGEIVETSENSITVPGYADLYLNKEQPEIELINPDTNTVFFKYKLYSNNEMVLETDAIKPGEVIRENLVSLLGTGEHKIRMDIYTYDITSQLECNGATQDISVTIK